MYQTIVYSSPLGSLLLAAEENQLKGLWIKGQKYYAAALPEGCEQRETPLLTSVCRWLDSYFAGENPDPKHIPLAPAGSAFRQIVWGILREIPYGQVTTYREVARQAAQKMGRQSMSAQAVGGAVGHNPISILIPCHRVIGSDHSLTGYAGGLEKKRWLLELEGAVVLGGIEDERK